MKPSLIGIIGLLCFAGTVTKVVAAPPADRELDLVVLADLNGNASAELATLVSEPLDDGGAGKFPTRPWVYLRDSATGARFGSFGLFERGWQTLELIAVPLREGSLIGALQQHSDGTIRVTLYDPAMGEHIGDIEFLDTSRTAISFTYVRDAGLGVPGLAVLAYNYPIDGRRHSYRAGEEVIIEVRKLETGEQLLKTYYEYYPVWEYGYDVTPLAIVPVDDQNGNGSSELAAFASMNYPNEPDTIGVVARDTYSAEYLSPYFDWNGLTTFVYTNTSEPVGFAALPDATGDGQAELAVLGAGDDGFRLQLREFNDAALVGSRRIPVNLSPRNIRALGDVDGNGSAEVAVAAVRSDGRNFILVLDGATQNRTSRIRFLNNAFDLRDFVILPDQSGNGVEELAVIGRNNETGAVRIQIRDAATGEHLRTLFRP